MSPSTVAAESETAVPAPFNKIGGASVQTYFQRIRKACGKWPWELFDEERLSPHWTVYLLQKLHQAIKLAQSSPKISLTLVMKHLESIWIGEKKEALSKQTLSNKKQRKTTEKESRNEPSRKSVLYEEQESRANNSQKLSASLLRNRDGDRAKSSDATLVHDKIVVAPSPSPPPRPRVYQNDDRDIATPPFIDLTKSPSPEPLGNGLTEGRPTGDASGRKKRKAASEVTAGNVPAPKRQKKSSKAISTPSATRGAGHQDVRKKDITDDENAHISRLNSKTIAIRNEADCINAQQNENEKRLKSLNSSRQLLQQELNTAQNDLTRIRQDIQDSATIRGSILRIIQRRASENVDGWNMALERCDKSLKIFRDDSKKTTELLNKKKQDLKNVDEMVGLAKRETEKCAQQAKKLAAQLEGLTHSKTGSDVL
ncbi:uncharacterized protein FFUJ_12499 [Fusarium fujikuroi IMI 58289]|uniref:Uncharacterized protein n=1 Tax=Gibberella fujikuroi (strain CBS 195.34 / IMI 58289 / NRRL A-6831) TaxID=1279085 RepID=S0ECD8_GIBF5|nr:uncharacterized protein FFUJ_12499 [Fusarium fujikuroi IMI 58289]KLO99606.1 uncharacterized protein LW94_14136 [Fusarium fujikuroi]CCT72616.1 uncharacterized protein FFUJ_12499 [Fusarium fujikuroi IMI 58289]